MDVARNCIYSSAMQNGFAETLWIDSDIGTSTLPRAMSNDCGVVNRPPPCVSSPRKLDENSPASIFPAPAMERGDCPTTLALSFGELPQQKAEVGLLFGGFEVPVAPSLRLE